MQTNFPADTRRDSNRELNGIPFDSGLPILEEGLRPAESFFVLTEPMRKIASTSLLIVVPLLLV